MFVTFLFIMFEPHTLEMQIPKAGTLTPSMMQLLLEFTLIN